ncbi:hypothetical protein O181_054109 [Austropuccinia psidii MF-1]|uniref:Tf2-1-like SH3-like domain-containing protein n=1 Tax=Austropuccinia psidii MF-1 TaxID=1389203 RepID=A0A9Q3E3X0_9BASI|nr:hypothetical protein [Austropuccinia psidii MF-1]
MTIPSTAKDFHDMWKRACVTCARCIAESKEYKKQKYEKTHKDPDFREGNKVLVLNLSFKKSKVPQKMRDSFVGPFTIIRLIGKNAVEVRLTEEFSRKHPVLPVSLVKTYNQKGDYKFPSRKKSHTLQDRAEVEYSPRAVKKIMKARKIRHNGKDHRKYLVIFKNQTADKNKWLEED